MSKTVWNKGRNCVFTSDFESFKTGDKAWVFDSTESTVTLLTKTSKDVAPERALKKCSLTVEQASACVRLTIGKPRANFKDVLVSQDEVNALVESKLNQL